MFLMDRSKRKEYYAGYLLLDVFIEILLENDVMGLILEEMVFSLFEKISTGTRT